VKIKKRRRKFFGVYLDKINDTDTKPTQIGWSAERTSQEESAVDVQGRGNLYQFIS
jgi:hypothetical protein